MVGALQLCLRCFGCHLAFLFLFQVLCWCCWNGWKRISTSTSAFVKPSDLVSSPGVSHISIIVLTLLCLLNPSFFLKFKIRSRCPCAHSFQRQPSATLFLCAFCCAPLLRKSGFTKPHLVVNCTLRSSKKADTPALHFSISFDLSRKT